MPIQEAPLRVFRTFICIKRIPPPPLFYYALPPLPSPAPIPLPLARYLADVCFLPHPLSESTSTFCSLPSISAQHAHSLFRFYTSFYPSSLYLSTLSPLALLPSFATYCLSPLCVSSRNSNTSSTLEYLFLT